MVAISRRLVLLTLGGVVVAGAGVSLGACQARSRMARLSLERLNLAVAGIPGAARIGHAMRAQMSQTELVAAVVAQAPLVSALEIDCPASRLRQIQLQVRAEFEAEDIIVADRWVVSRSEALIAALCTNGTVA